MLLKQIADCRQCFVLRFWFSCSLPRHTFNFQITHNNEFTPRSVWHPSFGETAHYHKRNRNERDAKGFEWSNAISISLLCWNEITSMNWVLCWVSIGMCVCTQFHASNTNVCLSAMNSFGFRFHFVSGRIRLYWFGLLIYRWTLFTILCLCVYVVFVVMCGGGGGGSASISFIRFGVHGLRYVYCGVGKACCQCVLKR